MKTKLVLWGKNAEEKRVLAAIELKAESNMVGTYTFSEETATDDFANSLMQNWRDGKPMEFPAEHAYTELPLSVTEPIIPEGLNLERPDLLSRAQTEWHFVVLSAKLYEVYTGELEDIADKITKLEKYDSGVWEQLKGFWNKVRGQIKDQNLFREHANAIQNGVNEQFNNMKQLRAKQEEAFQNKSKELADTFFDKLTTISEKITEGKRLASVFDELKQLQRKFREVKLTKTDRTKVWEKLDGAFKAVKEKRYGPDANKDNSAMSRFERRLDGLLKAIERMEKSIQRDVDDLEFQKRKIARTDGQLEAQIRQAKIVMIQERMRSKQERLEDMKKTQTQVERQIEKQKEREARRAEKERLEAAKKEAAAKLEAEMKAAAAAMDTEKLEKAAEAIIERKQPDSPATTTTNKVAEQPAESVSTTETVVTQAEEAIAATTEQVTEVVTEIAETTETVVEQAEEVITATTEQVTEAVTEVAEATEAVVEQAAETVEENAVAVQETINEAAADVEDKAADVVNEVESTAESVADAIQEGVEEVVAEEKKGE